MCFDSVGAASFQGKRFNIHSVGRELYFTFTLSVRREFRKEVAEHMVAGPEGRKAGFTTPQIRGLK